MKQAIIAVSCISAFFLASCMNQSDNSSSGSTLPTPPVRTFDESYDMLHKNLRSDAGFQDCMQRQLNTCAIQSVTERARTKDDVAICDELSEENFRDNCKQMIVLAQAQKTGDESRCNILSGSSKQGCVTSIVINKAVQSWDVKLCDKIESISWETAIIGRDYKNQCVLKVIQTSEKSDIKSCELLDGNFQNECKQIIEMKKRQMESMKRFNEKTENPAR